MVSQKKRKLAQELLKLSRKVNKATIEELQRQVSQAQDRSRSTGVRERVGRSR